MVAGARGMMRYRRNRASTMEGQQGGGGSSSGGNNMPPQQQQQLLPSQGIGYGVGANAGGQGGAPWAMYQNNGKPAGSNMPVRSYYN